MASNDETQNIGEQLFKELEDYNDVLKEKIKNGFKDGPDKTKQGETCQELYKRSLAFHSNINAPLGDEHSPFFELRRRILAKLTEMGDLLEQLGMSGVLNKVWWRPEDKE